jgi:hypothetical protein
MAQPPLGDRLDSAHQGLRLSLDLRDKLWRNARVSGRTPEERGQGRADLVPQLCDPRRGRSASPLGFDEEHRPLVAMFVDEVEEGEQPAPQLRIGCR